MKIKDNDINKFQNSDYVLVAWDESYATKIPLIDSQHMELVKLTNQLFNACLAGNNAAGTAFKETMSRLVEYVRFHFTTELKLLERINYPEYKDHKLQHDTLVKKILEAVKDYGDGKKFVPNHFVRTLKEWVFGHIAIYDKKYSFYVLDQKKKGLLPNLDTITESLLKE